MGKFMTAAARAHAEWELDVSRKILGDPKRVRLLLCCCRSSSSAPRPQRSSPSAAAAGDILPDILGGKKAYSPAFYSTGIFLVSILIGLCAGLITGCIGAGGGFIITPALMSAGIKGILAVGTDLFHIFAKAIMGSVIHRKLGNVSVTLAITFLVGAIGGALVGGLINRTLYEINPVLSDTFITIIYSSCSAFSALYALIDFLKAAQGRRRAGGGAHGGKSEGAELATCRRSSRPSTFRR